MGNVFSQKPLKEIVRENQRMLKKSIRELEKEIKTLENNEKKLIADIKKHAKMNQMVNILLRSQYLLRGFVECSLQSYCPLGCSEDYGQGPRSNKKLYHSLHRNENSFECGVIENAGNLSNTVIL